MGKAWKKNHDNKQCKLQHLAPNRLCITLAVNKKCSSLRTDKQDLREFFVPEIGVVGWLLHNIPLEFWRGLLERSGGLDVVAQHL